MVQRLMFAQYIVQAISLPDFTAYQPCYFNSGCCCFDDGDITGLEIENGLIRLVKWKYIADKSTRILLEEISLEQCIAQTLTVPQ